MAKVEEFQLKIDPNAPCIFCSAQPTTTANVPVSVRVSLPQAPCCDECQRKHARFKRVAIIAMFLSGQIISFSLGFLYPNVSGDPRENFIGFIIMGFFCILPVGLLFALVSRLIYVRQSRKWLRKYTDYYS
jgi:hypothetical protein